MDNSLVHLLLQMNEGKFLSLIHYEYWEWFISCNKVIESIYKDNHS